MVKWKANNLVTDPHVLELLDKPNGKGNYYQKPTFFDFMDWLAQEPTANTAHPQGTEGSQAPISN